MAASTTARPEVKATRFWGDLQVAKSYPQIVERVALYFVVMPPFFKMLFIGADLLQKCLFAQQKTAPSSQGTVSSAVLVVPYCGSITAYRYRQVPPGNPLGLLYTVRR